MHVSHTDAAQSYALWYTSNHNYYDNFSESSHPNDQHGSLPSGTQNAGPHPARRPQTGHIARSPLAQLRADEQYMERRKQNVQNYGSSWIKPPGIGKSLHQLREERREMEEHQESLRREQLAQELADAEAAEEGSQLDAELDQTRDLDDDVPDADETALDPDDSDQSDVTEEDDTARLAIQRIPDDHYRDALMRGEEIGGASFGAEGNAGSDEEDGSQLLQEEDLAHDETLGMDADLDMDMDMDGDLDGDVPEAEGQGYEHTDTEEELSSTDDASSDQETSSNID